MEKDVVRNRLRKKITSLSIDEGNLKKILNILQVRAKEASRLELDRIQSLNPPNIDEVKRDLLECSVLKVTVTGYQNEELSGSIEEILNSHSFPEKVKSVYLNSELIYATIYKYTPANSFHLFIDFSKPSVFDFSFQPSEKTPNESEFVVHSPPGYTACFTKSQHIFLRHPLDFRLFTRALFTIFVFGYSAFRSGSI